MSSRFGIQPWHGMAVAFSSVGSQQGIDDCFPHCFGGGQEQLADVVVVDHASVARQTTIEPMPLGLTA